MKKLLILCLLPLLPSCWRPDDAGPATQLIRLKNVASTMNVFIILERYYGQIDTLAFSGLENYFSAYNNNIYIWNIDNSQQTERIDTISEIVTVKSGKCHHLEDVFSCKLNGELVVGNEVIISY